MWPYTIEANGTSGNPAAPLARAPSAHPTRSLRHAASGRIDLRSAQRGYVGRGVKLFAEMYWSGHGRS